MRKKRKQEKMRRERKEKDKKETVEKRWCMEIGKRENGWRRTSGINTCKKRERK